MKCHRQDTRVSDAGFTIMELMFVLLLIGILALIGIVSYQGSTGRAEEATCLSNQRTLSTAMTMYRSVNGTGCGDIADLEAYARDVDTCGFCPSDGTPLIPDPSSDQVNCPNHPR